MLATVKPFLSGSATATCFSTLRILVLFNIDLMASKKERYQLTLLFLLYSDYIFTDVSFKVVFQF